jgi:hypothetical protein
MEDKKIEIDRQAEILHKQEYHKHIQGKSKAQKAISSNLSSGRARATEARAISPA